MDQGGFAEFLKRGGRSPNAIKRVMALERGYAKYLHERRGGVELNDAGVGDLEAFVEWIEREPKASAKSHLWGIRYYYTYSANEGMSEVARMLRSQRIKRTPFALDGFRGVNPEHLEKLAAVGIRNVEQMLAAGQGPRGRDELVERTGIPPESILELVKLSDLARIPGVKGSRARLYHDAGVDTVEKMAEWDAEELRVMVVEFVERTEFEGIATLPAEARFTVAQAKKLPNFLRFLQNSI